MSYNIQPIQPGGILVTQDERQMGLFLHLSQLANIILFPLGIVVPIILWQTQKEKIPALDEHGKMVVNWMISHLIYAVVSFVLVFVIIGIIFPIIGAVKANNGELWQYPLTIKFLK